MRKFKLKDRAAKRIREMEKNGGVTEKPSGIRTETPKETAEKADPAIRLISRTDIGLVRRSNQDALILGHVFGVADGMGGHNGGETASASARDGILRDTKDLTPSPDALEEAVRKVNGELWDMQLGSEELSGMGTTLTVLWPADEAMLIGHVGDSRAYLWRKGTLRQVTEDHSMVADMVRRGILTEEQAAAHPMRNYITRAVGTEPTIRVDVLSLPREKGDRWLICSDGLHSLVGRERLQELMAAEDLDESADQMIREALDRGGRDNISLVIALDSGAPAQEDGVEHNVSGEASAGEETV